MTIVFHYHAALWALLCIIATMFVQWFVASGSKARLPGAVPGKMPENLGHESFVFRAHRTFMNSLENVPMMLATGFLALFTSVSPQWTAALLWLFAICRLIHMVLYYLIATERNPSPRSYFFLLGVGANAGLLVAIALALL